MEIGKDGIADNEYLNLCRTQESTSWIDDSSFQWIAFLLDRASTLYGLVGLGQSRHVIKLIKVEKSSASPQKAGSS